MRAGPGVLPAAQKASGSDAVGRTARSEAQRRRATRYEPSCQPFGIDDNSFFVYWCWGCR